MDFHKRSSSSSMNFEKQPQVSGIGPIVAKGYQSELSVADGILHVKVSRLLSLGGARGREVPFNDVIAVQVKPATLAWNGYIRFLIAGDDPQPPQSKAKTAPTPGLVMFTWQRRQELARVRDQIASLRPDLPITDV